MVSWYTFQVGRRKGIKMKDLKSLLIIILCFLLPLIICVYFGWDNAEAELSDETLEEVRKLSYKHYGWYKGDLISTGVPFVANDSIKWTRDFLSIWVKDGKLFVETQDGTWFIEMEKVNNGFTD